jgi:hypothetical protein
VDFVSNFLQLRYHFGEEMCIKGFGGETCGKEGTGLDGRIILKLIFEKWVGERGLD